VDKNDFSASGLHQGQATCNSAYFNVSDGIDPWANGCQAGTEESARMKCVRIAKNI
jgi:hypothetical protein